MAISSTRLARIARPERCGNCKWFKASSKLLDQAGDCRARAPNPADKHSYAFPQVGPLDWCGAFKQRTARA